MQELFNQLHDFIAQPWPWFVAGPLLAIMMVVLLFLGHEFGISENFRIMCAAEGADNLNEFFKFDWKSGGWNLMVALGAILGGYFAAQFFFQVLNRHRIVQKMTGSCDVLKRTDRTSEKRWSKEKD